MHSKQVSRRLFLQGVGGSVLAAPFLGSLAERRAGAAAGSLDPKRLLVYFTHYGCITNRWFPERSHGQLMAADYESTSLKALAPHAQKLLMVRGIRAMNEWSFAQERGQETDPHTQVMGTYFTCCPADGWSGLGNPPPGVSTSVPKRKFDCRPVGGRSLDHICAEQVSPNKTPLYLAVGGAQATEYSNFSYSVAGTKETQATPYPAIGAPQVLYNNLTVGGASTDASYATARRSASLDIARDDLLRLRAQPLSTSDKQKLEAWEALLTSTTNMVREGCTADATTQLQGDIQALPENRTLEKATPLMLSLAALSMLCDDNRVVFMKFPGFQTFPFLDITGESMGLSHRVGSANMAAGCVSGVTDKLARIDTWYAEQFASLVKLLDDIPEGSGTLLDNTATVWMQEMSDGNSHNLNNLPILQAGGCGGYFKTGCAINVEDGAPDMSQGTSEDACLENSPQVTLGIVGGTDPSIANVPINKYYCSLMNAIGVKAGADGFAALGGTERVTHFGMYDDTKDFIPFLTDTPVPPTIHKPGELEALKA
jgi:Protein of unknown function (DUF1552)